MSDFIARIDICLERLNIKRTALCDALKISRTAVTDWKRRGTIPAGDLILRMSDMFTVSPWWLVFGEEREAPAEPAPTADEAALLARWRSLSQGERDAVGALMSGFEQRREVGAEKKAGAV